MYRCELWVRVGVCALVHGWLDVSVRAYRNRIQGGESVKEEEPGEANVAFGTNLTEILPVEEKMPPEQVLQSAASSRYSFRLHLSLTPTL